MNKKERINKAYEYLKYNHIVKGQNDVAEAMGTSRPNVSAALSGREQVLTKNFLLRFAHAFASYISADWLLTGEGEMLVNPSDPQPAAPHAALAESEQHIDQSSLVNAALAAKDETIAALKAQIAAKNETIATKDALIASLRDQLTTNASLIASLRDQLTANDALIASLRDQLTAKDAVLDAKERLLQSARTDVYIAKPYSPASDIHLPAAAEPFPSSPHVSRPEIHK